MNVGAEKWEEETHREIERDRKREREAAHWVGRKIFNLVGQVEAAGGALNFHFHLQLYNHILIFAQIGLTNLDRGREADRGQAQGQSDRVTERERGVAKGANRAKLQQIKTTPAKRATKLVWHEKQRRLAGRRQARGSQEMARRRADRDKHRDSWRNGRTGELAKWQTDRSAGCAAQPSCPRCQWG